MKYSILGFNQELVCGLMKEVQREDGSTKTLCLDITDLLILKNIADFMNRSHVVKLMINDNVYFSITQKTIIEDLPILGIKKQALKDRIDKMTLLGVIEKEVLRNECGTWIGYRLTDVYERLRYYDAKNSEGVYQTTRGGCSPLHEGGVAQYNPNNNTTINVNTKEEDTNVSPKKNDYKAIVDCWNEYNGDKLGKVVKLTERRKKAIKRMMDDNGIDQEQLMKLFKSLPYADKWLYNPNKQHQNWKPDFDWWMANTNGWLTKALEGKVHNENPQAFASIVRGDELGEMPYTPQTDGNIHWNDYYKCYIFIGMFRGEVTDGYTDDNRPNGATLMLNNGAGTIKWNKEGKSWIKL